MSEWPAVLRMVSSAMGVRDLDSSVEKLQAFESAIFLAQSTGVELGYGFVEMNGVPHSRALRGDFDQVLQLGEVPEYALGPVAAGKIRRLRDAISKPDGYVGTEEGWLIFVASILLESKELPSVVASLPLGDGQLAQQVRASLNGLGIAA